MLVCEMFLWKGRTYGYSVGNAVTGRGWEIYTRIRIRKYTVRVLVCGCFLLQILLLMMCHRMRSFAYPVVEDAFIYVNVHANLDILPHFKVPTSLLLSNGKICGFVLGKRFLCWSIRSHNVALP
jgi:hypothetical protein